MEEAVPLGEAITEGFKRDVQRLATYFYPDDRLIVSMRVTSIQQAFDTMMGLFNHVGLQ